MKKTLSIIIAFVASLQIAFSQNVTINDPNFLAALISAGVDTDNDGIIQKSEAQAKTYLDLNSKNISDLTGIEEFTNLTKLYCPENNLSNIDCSKNTKLTSLYINLNPITNLDLSQNVKLEILYCEKNQLTSLDLSKNNSLNSIYCKNNKLTSLILPQNGKLEILDCSINQLTNFDLTNSTYLIYINCSDNKLESLDVNTCLNLKDILCGNNKITTLILTNNSQLSYLSCYSNPLISLDLTQNVNLLRLICSSTKFNTLDLSKCVKLIELNIVASLIENLDLSNNPLLETLYCSEIKIAKLDLRNNHKLSYFRSSSSPLTKMICLSDESMTLKASYPNDFSKDPNTIWSTTCELPLTTGIENATIENIGIYPNPSNGIIHISNNQYFTDLKISNLNAETVFSSTLSESIIQSFDINTWPAGIYVIELSNGIAQQKSKLVICKN